MTDDPKDDAFLARWSRQKAQDGRETPAPQSEPPARPLEEILAELPALDEIGPNTDMRGFLKADVPPQLRAAALSRLWLADPAIRDRVPDAIDYAENYNAPETILGWGPADPGQAEALVARAHGFLDDVVLNDASPDGAAAGDVRPNEPETPARAENAASAPKTTAQEATNVGAEGASPAQNVERIAKHGSALPRTT